MDVVIPKVAVPQSHPGPGHQPAPRPDAENPQEAYAFFDQRDEAQIVDALKGRFLEDFVFSFCKRHRTSDGRRPPECDCPDVVVGLSWLGVQEAAREYKGIRIPIEKLVKRETDDAIEVIVEAIDEKTGNSRIGVANQPKKIRLRTGAVIDDEFAVSKAVSKAQRNAIRPLLPVTLIKAWIAAKLGKTASLTAQATPPPLPAPTAPSPAVVKANGNGWHPSVAQVKRAFALAFGNNVTRKQLKELAKALCGVEDPALINNRAGYETLCTALQRGGLPA